MKRASRPSPIALRAWLRFAALLALGLLAGDHVLPSLHYALVAHEMCPEHGQLEHVGTRARASFHHERGPVYDAGTADDEHHDHCGSVPASPPRAPLVAAPTYAFAPARALVAPTPQYRARVLAADVVAFAPKQSPPA